MGNNLMGILKDDNLSIAMPNELFTQLIEMKELKTVHIGFTYSYIYLQTYMYRYTTYGAYIPSKEDIKEVLTYVKTNKTLDYIIKKDGLLEQQGILLTDNDFPIMNEFIEGEPIFTTIRQFCHEQKYEDYDVMLGRLQGTRRSDYKYPVFAFERNEDEEGTFYDTPNTTKLDMPTFMFCMQTEGIGVNGFYLYAYLSHQNFKFKGDFNATLKRIAKEIGLSYGTVYELMKHMREHNLIETVHNMEYFSFAIAPKDRIASTHKVNNRDKFTVYEVEYRKLDFVSNKEHKARQDSKFNDGKIEIDISDLPF